MHQQKRIPLAKYRFGKQQLSAEDTLAKQVYVIRSSPKVVPVDVNMQWLMQAGGDWNPALDRLRYSQEQLFIRKFSPQTDTCVVVQLSPVRNSNSLQLTLYGNDSEQVELFFRNLFLGNHLQVVEEEMSVVSRGWVDTPHDLLYFCGSVHAAFGLWGNMLVEMQLSHAPIPGK